jgi:hypothetical protein
VVFRYMLFSVSHSTGQLHRIALSLLIGLIFGTSSSCWAQLSDSGRSSLAATLLSAQQSLDSSRLPDYEQVEIRVVQAASEVENYFRPITTNDNLEKWMGYLLTEPLVEAMQSDADSDTVVQRAQKTHNRLIGNIPGLELPALVRLRDAVDQLLATTRYQDRDKSIKFVDQQLLSLLERIEKLEPIPSTEEAASLAAIVRVISESNLSPSVLANFRTTFSRPNLVLSVSSALVERAASQVVCRDREINDCILGTRLIGTGTLQGTVSSRTLPSFGQATIQLTLQGRFHSRSTGYNGPVTLQTLGDGNVTSTRTLFISESGVSLSPTSTNATLASRITSINHPLKLVRKIASKRAAQQKPQADAIAREKFRSRVHQEFDTQVSTAVSSAPSGDRAAAMSKAQTTLVRLNVPEPTRMISSNEYAIMLEATQAGQEQISAINPAPYLQPFSYDIAIQLHESLVDNVASRILAGRTMSGAQLDRLMADMGRPRQPANNVSDDQSEEAVAEEPFVIDFARFRPIIFEARDQTVRIGLRGTRFKQGDREIKQPLEITATYRPIQTMDGKMFLERTGDVGVDFPGNRRLTISQVALKRSIQRSFSDRFPPSLLDKTISLPSTLPIASMSGQTVRSTVVDACDGWLSISAR